VRYSRSNELMSHKVLPSCIISLLFILISLNGFSQKWDFIKEKDGIKIYTRNEKDSDLKSFRGTADLHTTTDKLYQYLGNGNNVNWWDKNVSEIKVLSFEKDKFIKYYLVYGVPWPLTDRDLCVETKITTDPVTGIRTILAQPLLNVVPEKTDRIRIKKYWQKWTVEPMPEGIVHVSLEGFVDPGGSVPAWLYNMVITDTPMKVIREVRRRVE
jgi:hypothetical protein